MKKLTGLLLVIIALQGSAQNITTVFEQSGGKESPDYHNITL
jgi:hypothetical protein